MFTSCFHVPFCFFSFDFESPSGIHTGSMTSIIGISITAVCVFVSASAGPRPPRLAILFKPVSLQPPADIEICRCSFNSIPSGVRGGAGKIGSFSLASSRFISFDVVTMLSVKGMDTNIGKLAMSGRDSYANLQPSTSRVMSSATHRHIHLRVISPNAPPDVLVAAVHTTTTRPPCLQFVPQLGSRQVEW